MIKRLFFFVFVFCPCKQYAAIMNEIIKPTATFITKKMSRKYRYENYIYIYIYIYI